METAGFDQDGKTPVCNNALFKSWALIRSTAGAASFSPTTASGSSDQQSGTPTRRGGSAGVKERTSATTYMSSDTQAKLLFESDADIKTFRQRLGHSSARFTIDIYAHFIA